ncbi:ABC transporter permease [Actinomyces sp. Z3]|uniref:ABC transporter permease n=1 Tax=Actinomyces sp. Z3 TaxID=2250217 RepID=UPI002852D3E6|nr:ABC transporter permease [Actinomyces sp. Z3]
MADASRNDSTSGGSSRSDSVIGPDSAPGASLETAIPGNAPEMADSAAQTARLTRGQILRRRFFRNKSAVGGLVGFGLIVLLAVVGPRIARYHYTEPDFLAFHVPPNADHWLGTTKDGSDVFAMVIEGLRKSLIIGLSVAAIQTGVAAIVGSAAAYFGGWFDKVALWVIDLLLVVPSFLIIAIVSQSVSGQSKGSIPLFIILLAAFGWMLTARVIRSMTLSVRNMEYVTAARYMGVSAPRIIARHILPNVSSYIIIDATLGIASAVLSETTLSYFGFGVKPPNTSLGTLIQQSQGDVAVYPWAFIAPAVVLMVMLVCVNLIGDGVRDALDSSSKSGGQA